MTFIIIYLIGFCFTFAYYLAKRDYIKEKYFDKATPYEMVTCLFSLIWFISFTVIIFYKIIKYNDRPKEPKQHEQKPIEEHLIN